MANRLKALQGRQWGAVLDTSAYVPSDVARSADLLAKNISHYLIVSTLSVYARMDKPGMDESAPLMTRRRNSSMPATHCFAYLADLGPGRISRQAKGVVVVGHAVLGSRARR